MKVLQEFFGYNIYLYDIDCELTQHIGCWSSREFISVVRASGHANEQNSYSNLGSGRKQEQNREKKINKD